ncbi:MAG: hypothetical protein EAX87_12130, partial [Candidatus Thorarchaeota archaeon]|nr:hypothetical protein [Candidatus Thorarchaeota archaeon]
MKTYHVIIALLVVCAVAGMQVQTSNTGVHPVTITNPQVQQVPHALAEIAPFDTAIVWSTSVGNQVVDLVVDNFDADSRDEVAVITQNGTLFLLDDNSTLLWRLNLGSTPHALASFDGTAADGQEILIGTDYGVLVIGADKTVQMNMSLPEPVYAVAGGNFDGDAFEEVVVGCDDFYVYAFDTNTTQLWSYLSNGKVRLIAGANIDTDPQTELVVASQGKRFTLLQDDGSIVFEKTSGTAITVVAMGNLTTTKDWDVLYGNTNGTLNAWNSTGSPALKLELGSSISALRIGDLVTDGGHEFALGTASNQLRVYTSDGVLSWNKTMGGQPNDIRFANIGNLTNSQVLVGTPNTLTTYNSTGWRVKQITANGFTGALSVGDLDNFGGQEYAYGTNIGGVSTYGRDLDKDGLADAREIIMEGTLYNNPDTDGDKLNDGEEVLTYDTNPLKSDTDGDNLSDFAEVITYGTDPNSKDSDGDKLTDWQEIYLGTDPNQADTDGDSLTDYEENNITLTLPTDTDSDDDGINDAQDDNDGDGLTNIQEVRTTKTDPNDVDSDSDGISDYYDDQDGDN